MTINNTLLGDRICFCSILIAQLRSFAVGRQRTRARHFGIPNAKLRQEYVAGLGTL